jgi:hypothetical protein
MRILMKAMSLTGARVPYAVSTALVVGAILPSGASFLFWRVFDRDVPMTVGNMMVVMLTIETERHRHRSGFRTSP